MLSSLWLILSSLVLRCLKVVPEDTKGPDDGDFLILISIQFISFYSAQPSQQRSPTQVQNQTQNSQYSSSKKPGRNPTSTIKSQYNILLSNSVVFDGLINVAKTISKYWRILIMYYLHAAVAKFMDWVLTSFLTSDFYNANENSLKQHFCFISIVKVVEYSRTVCCWMLIMMDLNRSATEEKKRILREMSVSLLTKW